MEFPKFAVIKKLQIYLPRYSMENSFASSPLYRSSSSTFSPFSPFSRKYHKYLRKNTWPATKGLEGEGSYKKPFGIKILCVLLAYYHISNAAPFGSLQINGKKTADWLITPLALFSTEFQRIKTVLWDVYLITSIYLFISTIFVYI